MHTGTWSLQTKVKERFQTWFLVMWWEKVWTKVKLIQRRAWLSLTRCGSKLPNLVEKPDWPSQGTPYTVGFQESTPLGWGTSCRDFTVYSGHLLLLDFLKYSESTCPLAMGKSSKLGQNCNLSPQVTRGIASEPGWPIADSQICLKAITVSDLWWEWKWFILRTLPMLLLNHLCFVMDGVG